MDTVWIRLVIAQTIEPGVNRVSTVQQSEQFMFGPTGIVRFATKDNKTSLFNSNKLLIADVIEDSDHIMGILRKMRGTEGRLHEKKSTAEKEKSTAKTQRRKVKSKI